MYVYNSLKLIPQEIKLFVTKTTRLLGIGQFKNI